MFVPHLAACDCPWAISYQKNSTLGEILHYFDTEQAQMNASVCVFLHTHEPKHNAELGDPEPELISIDN